MKLMPRAEAADRSEPLSTVKHLLLLFFAVSSIPLFGLVVKRFFPSGVIRESSWLIGIQQDGHCSVAKYKIFVIRAIVEFTEVGIRVFGFAAGDYRGFEFGAA